jgi:hypothetical protein
MTAMMQQVTQRRRHKWRENKIEIREIAGKPARYQKQAPTQTLLSAIRFWGQASMNQFAGCQPCDGMTEIIHGAILSTFAVSYAALRKAGL